MNKVKAYYYAKDFDGIVIYLNNSFPKVYINNLVPNGEESDTLFNYEA
jgi:hypothetical protein